MRRPGHPEKCLMHGGRVVEAESYPAASLLPGAPHQHLGWNMLESAGDGLCVVGNRL